MGDFDNGTRVDEVIMLGGGGSPEPAEPVAAEPNGQTATAANAAAATATAEPVFQAATATAEPVFQAATATAEPVFQAATATAEPVFQAATATAEPVFQAATATAEPVDQAAAEPTAAAEPAAEEEATANAADGTQQIMDSIAELSGKVEQMNKLFEQKIAHTTHEEKIVDQMHAELQKYKEDMYAKLVRPILLDIILVRDSILRMTANFAAKPEGEQDVPLRTFSDYSYDLQDILEKNNITVYDGKVGEAFDPTKQRVVKKLATTEEALQGKVAECLSSGYEYQGKTISPEKVVVYVYQKAEGESN